MKIGLMTWFRYNNYGTVLQAYALQEIIKKLNYTPLLLDYKPRGNNKEIKDIKTIYRLIREKIQCHNNFVNNNIFDKFIDDYLNTTDKYNNYFELCKVSQDFNGFVCGSDQIWSPDNFDENYFLPFAPANKIMSYAPSFGKGIINNKYIIEKLKPLIKRFSVLSVRETTGQRLIKKICGVDAKVVLDPTILLKPNDWNKIINNKLDNSLKKTNYILCYFLGESNRYFRQIKKYAEENHFTIINIPIIYNQKISKYSFNSDIGPGEFVTLIKNAKAVFTDSFHGTIFSINYNVDFFTYKRFKESDERNQNSRIIDLLSELNLMSRLISSKSKIKNVKINYDSINSSLSDLRKESLNFLSDGLSIISKNDNYNCCDTITDLCCGCGACKNICSKNAIDIKINPDGFYQYYKNTDKCINCMLCKNVCPMKSLGKSYIDNDISCYSFKSVDEKILEKSSSGGAGYEIAKYYNLKGYYICGAAYDVDSAKVKHIIIKPNSVDDIQKIQSSKYLQSNTSDAFDELLKLPSSAKVVFFGTPCQVAAMNNLIKIKGRRDNYFLVDLICHGVPSYHLWNEYLLEINNKYKNSETLNINFRNKKYGWKNRYITIENRNIKYRKKDTKDMFYNFFKNSIVDNRCCYECPFRLSSSADLRIGDYWAPQFLTDKKGVSMVLAITELGDETIKELAKTNMINKMTINDYYNYQKIDNTNPCVYRDTIIEDLKKKTSTKKIYWKYFKYSIFKEIISNIYNRVRKKK